ncbi:MAG: polyhydroxyalkanoate synthesis regulator DNA-binding domain-containing protein [Thermoanaerobaculia bacterium]|nr:polyhydroxyalkanoate synthesis regulator DNA-binding domain-containing protein [Thermoanaerobaculia bacterium]
MVRLIKRYESRKLYDTEESRYVSLEEIASFVRRGQEVRVIDNASGEDVTTHTLTQVILEEGRSGRFPLSADVLHEFVRRGEQAVTTGVEQMQQGMDRLFQKSLERVGPLRRVREEMETLRSRLEGLEASLSTLEQEPARRKTPAQRPKKAASGVARKTAAAAKKRPAARKKAATKSAAKKS